MFPNLLGQQAYFKLDDTDMAALIGVTTAAYRQKLKTGRFTPAECAAFCQYFGRPFTYLFATEDELPSLNNCYVS